MEGNRVHENMFRVLLAEDDPAQRKTLAAIIADEGFGVIEAGTGAQALDLLAAGKADMAVVDLRLPDLSETEFLQRLANYAADIPILLYTGYASYETAREAIKTGIFAYVEKGGDPAKLLRELHRAIDQRLRERAERLEVAVQERTARLGAISSRQEAILAAIPDIIAEVNENKIYTWMNAAGLEFFGEDAIGREAAFYFEGPQDTYATVLPLFSGDSHGVYVESWQCRRDGQKRLLAWWCRALTGADGKVIGALSTGRDITANKRAEEALRQSEASLKTAEEIASVGHWFLDVKTGEVSWSDQMYRIVGLDPAKGPPPWPDGHQAIFHPADWKAVSRVIDEALTNRSTYDLISRFKRPNGTIGHLRIIGRPVGESDGKVRQFVGVIQDITELKRVEEALRAGEDQNRFLLDNTSDFIARFNRQGVMVFGTRASVRFHGYELEEILNTSAFERIHPDDHDSIRSQMRQLIETGGDSRAEYRVKRKNGEYMWVEAQGRRVFNAAGEPEIIVVQRDVTQRRHAADALRTQTSELAHLSRVASVGEMTTAIAHELNQPLGASLLYAETFRELMRKTGAFPGPMEKMERLIAGLEQARRIIQRIREFTRKHALALSTLDVGPLLREAAVLIEHEMRLAQIKIRYAVEEELPTVQGDRVFLQQVLVNLMMNALDAMTQETQRLRVLTLSAARDGQGACVISVEDTGTGLATEVAAKAFDAFITTKPHGLGLGLSLARTIVEEHGGRIWHEPAPSGGAIFRFTLPVANQKEIHDDTKRGDGLFRGR